jgi:hypothetical protein
LAYAKENLACAKQTALAEALAALILEKCEPKRRQKQSYTYNFPSVK